MRSILHQILSICMNVFVEVIFISSMKRLNLKPASCSCSPLQENQLDHHCECGDCDSSQQRSFLTLPKWVISVHSGVRLNSFPPSVVVYQLVIWPSFLHLFLLHLFSVNSVLILHLQRFRFTRSFKIKQTNMRLITLSRELVVSSESYNKQIKKRLDFDCRTAFITDYKLILEQRFDQILACQIYRTCSQMICVCMCSWWWYWLPSSFLDTLLSGEHRQPFGPHSKLW